MYNAYVLYLFIHFMYVLDMLCNAVTNCDFTTSS